MAYQKPKKLPQFSDLITVLARSKNTDEAIYQTIQEIINRLDQFIVAGGSSGTGTGPQGPTGPPGPMPALDQTFITVNPEGSLANHRQLIAGTNITLNTATPNQIAINAAGGGAGGGMEYLGDYIPGTYNDGDIVVWTDGIAYVCTKNGTTTPPEPWPGTGSGIDDAKYWVVSPHASLVNARALSSLANGYVKSTAGEPSTVPSIPPGDLPPFIAYTNVNNNFSTIQTFASGARIEGPLTLLYFRDNTAGTDLKQWLAYNSAGDFSIDPTTDAGAGTGVRFTFGRTGVFAAPAFFGN